MEQDLKWEFMNISVAGGDCKSCRDLRCTGQHSPAGSQPWLHSPLHSTMVEKESSTQRGDCKPGPAPRWGRWGYSSTGGAGKGAVGWGWRASCLQWFLNYGPAPWKWATLSFLAWSLVEKFRIGGISLSSALPHVSLFCLLLVSSLLMLTLQLSSEYKSLHCVSLRQKAITVTAKLKTSILKKVLLVQGMKCSCETDQWGVIPVLPCYVSWLRSLCLTAFFSLFLHSILKPMDDKSPRSWELSAALGP